MHLTYILKQQSFYEKYVAVHFVSCYPYNSYLCIFLSYQCLNFVVVFVLVCAIFLYDSSIF